MASANSPRKKPVAIIGSACRFAGNIRSPADLWRFLESPTDVSTDIPPDRFSKAGFYHHDPSYHGHSSVQRMYALEQHPGVFDAQFFHMKPMEAEAVDPQQRMLLEVVYEALESAGIAMDQTRGANMGVYVGLMAGDYENMALHDLDSMPMYHSTGTSRAMASNRISYFYDWHGPSLTLDTACSSSLYALHLAVQAVQSGEATGAVVCGSHLTLGPNFFVFQDKLQMVSPDGLSRMWDKEANGYARGDGVAALVIKSLPDALRDGDPIETIIRSVAVNQDGATTGITMPSVHAQVDLIRQAYGQVGLDCVTDRAQFFEAHGTGTQSGDMVEAAAIHEAITKEGDSSASTVPLFVGSIKTVLGHTEGTAGIAGVLKASLALQHSSIPPNLHFNSLSPRVAPFYKGVCVPVTTQTWPVMKDGQPRRASVNSFGFGGSNAHAILESLVDSPHGNNASQGAQNYCPYLFSAHSSRALVAMLRAYSKFLDTPRGVALHPSDLSWTLRERRTEFPYRAAFPASSIERLKYHVDTWLQSLDKSQISVSVVAPSARRILGVFSGQGVQYAQMGAQLVQRSAVANDMLDHLQVSLDSLPISHRPDWRLRDELLKDEGLSRIHSPAFSQPLVTATQIVIVEVLRQAGIHFHGVVGHSSGEIAAAYASGFISAEDAIRIAFYRGMVASHAVSPNGADVKGAMLAVGTSYSDAQELLEDESLRDRLCVAAINSDTDVTLAGDEDAIDIAFTVFKDEDKFCRKLQVDTAYHSPHIQPCRDPYVRLLDSCGTGTLEAQGLPGCTWYSTVHEDVDMTSGKTWPTLGANYWADNMTQPVLFSNGLARAIKGGDFSVILEIGPHPVLKRYIDSVMQAHERSLPRYGTLHRGSDPIESFSNLLGALWSQHQGSPSIDWSSYDRAMGGSIYRSCVVKDLPSYPWDHSNVYWHEPRQTYQSRHRKGPVHPLLGHLCPNVSSRNMTWRQLLRPQELPWLLDHKIEGAAVFPAAGYISVMVEAGRQMLYHRPLSALRPMNHSEISIIEAHSFVIHRAMVFQTRQASEPGIETVIQLHDIDIEYHQGDPSAAVVRARFEYCAALEGVTADLTVVASADAIFHVGPSANDDHDGFSLECEESSEVHLISVDRDEFFVQMEKCGYGYSGAFRSLAGLRRRMGVSEAYIDPSVAAMVETSSYTVHPAVLDSALQALLLAFSHPGDGMLWSVFVPVSVEYLRVCPRAALPTDKGPSSDPVLHVRASVVHQIEAPTFLGDVDVFSGSRGFVRLQGISVSPLPGASASTRENADVRPFALMRWGKMFVTAEDLLDGQQAVQEDERESSLCLAVERMCIFYMREWDRVIPRDHHARQHPTFKHYLRLCQHVTEAVQRGEHKYAPAEWADDKLEDVTAACADFIDTIDIKLAQTIGDIMPAAFQGEFSVQEHLFREDNPLLADYYLHALGQQQSARWIGRAVATIAHRFPRMNILEIGAGTGAATVESLSRIGIDGFRTYTFTDVSSVLMSQAEKRLSRTVADLPRAVNSGRLKFKVLDISSDPVAQGFSEGSFDLVIASYVVHVLPNLEEAMRRIRRLIRPGGFIVMAEITNLDLARIMFVFGTMPGMWAGVDEGRTLTPYVSVESWADILKKTGFSGLDVATPQDQAHVYACTVFISQAVDTTTFHLRQSLLPSATASGTQSLAPLTGQVDRPPILVVGGEPFTTRSLTDDLSCTLRQMGFADITHVPGPLELIGFHASPSTIIVCLFELNEKSLFENLIPEAWDSIRSLLTTPRSLLWFTGNRRKDNLYANIGPAVIRTARHETPGMRVQTIDIDKTVAVNAAFLARCITSFYHSVECGAQDSDLLCSFEQEIVIKSEDSWLVPRVEHFQPANDRYNSVRRDIKRRICPENVAVQLRSRDLKHFDLVEARRQLPASGSEETASTVLRTVASTLWPIETPLGMRVLFYGIDPNHSQAFLGFSPNHISLQSHDRCALVPVTPKLEEVSVDKYLVLVAAFLWSDAILDSAHGYGHIVVHNPTPALANVLTSRAVERSLRVTVTTDDRGTSIQRSWVHLSLHTPRRDIQRKLFGAKATIFFTFGLKGQPPSTLPYVPPGSRTCHLQSSSGDILEAFKQRDFSAQHPSFHLGTDILVKHLSRATNYVLEHGKEVIESMDGGQYQVVSIAENFEQDGSRALDHGMTTVVRWSNAPVQASISPRNFGDLFSPTKTYWLLGLTSGLGITVCDWMIAHGARHVVFSSRQPKIESSWLDWHSQNGVVVRILPCDVTSKSDVQVAYKALRNDPCLPPLGGIFQGAMVLDDKSLRDMDFPSLMKVLRPKVHGSVHLHDVLGATSLDFLVFMSSVVQTVGNAGQANYCAANAFMCALASWRRQCGLAGSTVNLGPILGGGYISNLQGDRKLSQNVWGLKGVSTFSEQDMLEALAEAIAYDIKGYPECADGARDIDPEILTALQAGTNPSLRPVWYDDPKFDRINPELDYVDNDPEAGKADTDAANPRKSSLTIKAQMQLAKTSNEVESLIQTSLLSNLRATLQLGEEMTSDEDLLRTRSDNLGIDSLIAVDLRSWLQKHFLVTVPTLTIVGGIKISELIGMVVSQLPPEMAPNVAQAEQPIAEADLKPQENERPQGVEPVAPRSYERPEATSSVSKPARVRSSDVSHAQGLFWTVHLLTQDKTTLNHTVLFRMTRKGLRVADLDSAVRALGQRHEVLRTCFVEEAGKPKQHVLDRGTLVLESRRIASEADAQQEFRSLANHIYDLELGHVMRFILLTTPDAEVNYVVTGAHHIAIDGHCLKVFLQDIQLAYNRTGGTLADDAPPIEQYVDVSTAQQADLASGRWDEDLAWWKSEFLTLPEPLPLTCCAARTRRPLIDYCVVRHDITIPPPLAIQLRKVAATLGSTAFHFYLATFRVLLHRLLMQPQEMSSSGKLGRLSESDICIGIATANRSGEDQWNSVGPYMNLLPLRFPADNTASPKSFHNVLTEAKERVLAALRHSAPSFATILQKLGIGRPVDHAPLFQAFVDYRQGWLKKITFLDCETEMILAEPGRVPYDLSLDIVDNAHLGQNTTVTVFGQEYLYDETGLLAVSRLYKELLQEFVQDPMKNADDPSWAFPREDVERTLSLGRGPTLQLSWPPTVAHRIQDTVQRLPHRVAIVDTNPGNGGGRSMSYASLWRCTVSLYARLRSLDIGRGCYVAVHISDHMLLPVCILAIMIAGAAYVPLDSDQHTARLRMILSDCQPSALLADKDTAAVSELIDPTQATTVVIVDPPVDDGLDCDKQQGQGRDTFENQADPSLPAAVLYTSGTTGKPKGVVLTHAALATKAEADGGTFNLDEQLVALQHSAYAFDMSLQQVLTPLCYGGTLCVLPHQLRGDAEAIADIIREFNVTFTCATPSEYAAWLRYAKRSSLVQSAWNVAISGGEPVPRGLLVAFRDLRKPDLRLYNGYGPTETTYCSSRMELHYETADRSASESGERGLPAGNVLNNESIVIIDNQMRIMPAGLSGEIVIGGVGVAAGYLRDEAATERAFLQSTDRLTAASNVAHLLQMPLFRTGDRGRLLSDGSLELDGRIEGSTVIKLRGIRVDLQDIENTIISCSEGAILAAVASERPGTSGDSNSAFLVAHVVFASPQASSAFVPATEVEKADYLSALLERLPLSRSICPARLLPIDEMPLTRSGKLDRKAAERLPLHGSVAPLTKTFTSTTCDEQLKTIWTRVLGLQTAHEDHQVPQELSHSTSFFHLGGTSLLLLELRSLIRTHFRVSPSLLQLFQASTLTSMAHLICELQNSDHYLGMESYGVVPDWEQETQVIAKPAETTKGGESLSSSPVAALHGKRIVLTGATGKLGSYVLRLLLNDSSVAKVHCIAVRNSKERLNADELQTTDARIVYHEGDLRAPRLGLSQSDFTLLGEEADCVIHVGAETSHVKTYQSLWAANVSSVKELASLCTVRMIPLHFVSTAEVGILRKDGAKAVDTNDDNSTLFELSEDSVTVNGLEPSRGDAVLAGYATSKWVAERYLENISAIAPALSIVIHRPPLLASEKLQNGDKVNGTHDAALFASPGAPLLESLVFYSRRMNSVPDTTGWLEGTLSIVHIEKVAETIVQWALQPSPETCGRCRPVYVHYQNDVEIAVAQLAQHVADQSPTAQGQTRRPDTLPLTEWISKARGSGLHALVAETMDSLAKTGHIFRFPRIECSRRSTES